MYAGSIIGPLCKRRKKSADQFIGLSIHELDDQDDSKEYPSITEKLLLLQKDDFSTYSSYFLLSDIFQSIKDGYFDDHMDAFLHMIHNKTTEEPTAAAELLFYPPSLLKILDILGLLAKVSMTESHLPPSAAPALLDVIAHRLVAMIAYLNRRTNNQLKSLQSSSSSSSSSSCHLLDHIDQITASMFCLLFRLFNLFLKQQCEEEVSQQQQRRVDSMGLLAIQFLGSSDNTSSNGDNTSTITTATDTTTTTTTTTSNSDGISYSDCTLHLHLLGSSSDECLIALLLDRHEVFLRLHHQLVGMQQSQQQQEEVVVVATDTNTSSSPQQLLALMTAQLDPLAAFIILAAHCVFDEVVLIDMMASKETRALEYLLRVTKYCIGIGVSIACVATTTTTATSSCDSTATTAASTAATSTSGISDDVSGPYKLAHRILSRIPLPPPTIAPSSLPPSVPVPPSLAPPSLAPVPPVPESEYAAEECDRGCKIDFHSSSSSGGLNGARRVLVWECSSASSSEKGGDGSIVPTCIVWSNDHISSSSPPSLPPPPSHHMSSSSSSSSCSLNSSSSFLLARGTTPKALQELFTAFLMRLSVKLLCMRDSLAFNPDIICNRLDQFTSYILNHQQQH